MTTPLDDAIATTSKAEAVFINDQQNVATIQAAINSATSPLQPAQDQLTTDTTAYKQALTNLAAVATQQANSL